MPAVFDSEACAWAILAVSMRRTGGIASVLPVDSSSGCINLKNVKRKQLHFLTSEAVRKLSQSLFDAFKGLLVTAEEKEMRGADTTVETGSHEAHTWCDAWFEKCWFRNWSSIGDCSVSR